MIKYNIEEGRGIFKSLLTGIIIKVINTMILAIYKLYVFKTLLLYIHLFHHP